jgi:hypothetical protein
MALAEDVRDTFNQHMLEDYTDWNSGPNANSPMIGFERDEEPDLAVADLIALFDKGILTLDDETEGWIRKRWNLPQRDPNAGPPRALPAPEDGEDSPSTALEPAASAGPSQAGASVRASAIRVPTRRRAPGPKNHA